MSLEQESQSRRSILLSTHYSWVYVRLTTPDWSERFGTERALGKAASLMKLIETPPPPLLRARFATVLDHLPSVPTVVLPFLSPVDSDRALSLLNH